MGIHFIGGTTIYESNDDFQVNSVAKALTKNTHYLDLYTLLDDFCTLGSLQWSVSDTTKKITIHNGGGANFTIDWDDVALRNFIGFDANLAGANTYTAANLPPFAFFPAGLIDGWETWNDLEGTGIQAQSDGGSIMTVEESNAPLRSGHTTLWIRYSTTDPDGHTKFVEFWRYAARGWPYAVFDYNSLGTGAWSKTNRTGYVMCAVHPDERRLNFGWLTNLAKTDCTVSFRTITHLSTGNYTTR